MRQYKWPLFNQRCRNAPNLAFGRTWAVSQPRVEVLFDDQILRHMTSALDNMSSPLSPPYPSLTLISDD